MRLDGVVPTLDDDLALLRANRRAQALANGGDGPPAALTEEIDGGDWRLRIHRPHDGVTPALLLVHGGGWVWGGIDEVDALARTVSMVGNLAVCSVAYRRAPEHGYPDALDDVDAAARWLVAHGAEHGIDQHRLAALGLSAGGNLVAALALRSRDGVTSVRLDAQLLAYPMLDPRLDQPSAEEFAESGAFSRERAHWFWHQYLRSTAHVDEYAAPALADDVSRLPPTYLVVPEIDILRDEALVFAERLRTAGVPVTVNEVPGGEHGFLPMGAVFPALQAQVVDDIVTWLRGRPVSWPAGPRRRRSSDR